jgi:hypothetical protein
MAVVRDAMQSVQVSLFLGSENGGAAVRRPETRAGS